MPTKPANARGTRDFDPRTLQRRQYLESVIREAFVRFGYREIQTPALENLDMLEGKYGDEGDRLLFRILNSGDFLGPEDWQELQQLPHPDAIRQLRSRIAEKALRYDLTVPFARYVVQHQNEITFPFKRFQLQPVWRADRPQKGRYREFVQCDADVVGQLPSLLHEVELLQLFDSVFNALGLAVEIQINDRRILAGLADVVGAPDQLVPLTVALDKADKIGAEGVRAELRQRNFREEQIQLLDPFLALEGQFLSVAEALEEAFRGRSEKGLEGVRQLKTLYGYLQSIPFRQAELRLNVALARGLNYYTAAIFEVKSLETPMGSIASGGRYDDLTALFGLSGTAGVGISFGLDRIYDVLESLQRWPTGLPAAPVDVLIANFGEALYSAYLPLQRVLQGVGLRTEIYPYDRKVVKQLEYADKMKISYVVFYGENESKEGAAVLKNLITGSQVKVLLTDLMALPSRVHFISLFGA